MSNKPIKSFYSLGVSASVFRNEATDSEGKDFTTFSCTLNRSYKKDDKTEYTNSLREGDLAIAHALLLKAFFWIQENK